MSAMAMRPLPVLVWQQLKRIGPLGLIILLHIGFFYAIQSGLMHKAAEVLPKEVFVTFITPEAPKPAAPAPAPPKAEPIKPKTTPKAHVPVINKTPSPNAISSPPVVAPPDPAPTPAPPAPPAPAVPAQPKTISSPPDYLQRPEPEYPAASMRMGEEGKTILRVLINERGKAEVIELNKSSGSPRLDEAAKQAVRRALFKPYMEDGKPIPVWRLVPINFQLD